ncbi:RDD family protein [Isoptericola jiangsuensis]|nr:RDD family protein [Isoptericola jiangsuensis]
MATRREFGSWLSGPDVPTGETTDRDSLGLPASGPGSRAGLGRRVVALCVDWAAASAISYAFFDLDSWATLGIFAVMNLILVGTVGSTLGHALLRLQVRRLDVSVPHLVGLGRSAVRALLLCLVIPAVVWDTDGRGLHDKAAGTVIVRR